PRESGGRSPTAARSGRAAVWHAGVGARLAARGGGLEPGQVVGPAAGVPGPFGGRQVAVLEVDAGAAAVGSEPDLDGAGAGRQMVRLGVAPADEQSARRGPPAGTA